MFKKLIPLLALLSTPAFADSLFEDAIFNGAAVTADGQTWRNTVGLQMEGFSCTGVLINYNTILTAAHCPAKSNSSIQVIFYPQNGSRSYVSLVGASQYGFARHPNYVPNTGYEPAHNDVAVIVMKNITLPEGMVPAEFQTSAQAYASDIGQTIYMVGAGMKEYGGWSEKLYFAKGSISSYRGNGIMEVDMNSGQGTCGGDSGGPIFVHDGGHLLLSAILHGSSGRLDANCGPHIYATQVNTPDIYYWIKNTAAALQ